MGGAEEQGGRCAALFLMSFLRHEKIYRSDVGLGHTESRRCGLPPALIGLDEFPVGYSLAGCSPADPASASPTGEHCAVNSSRRSKTFHRTANSVLTVCLISGGRSMVLWTHQCTSMIPRNFLRLCSLCGRIVAVKDIVDAVLYLSGGRWRVRCCTSMAVLRPAVGRRQDDSRATRRPKRATLSCP
jgi:hypothetical protein